MIPRDFDPFDAERYLRAAIVAGVLALIAGVMLAWVLAL
jgi:hypothetical protein